MFNISKATKKYSSKLEMEFVKAVEQVKENDSIMKNQIEKIVTTNLDIKGKEENKLAEKFDKKNLDKLFETCTLLKATIDSVDFETASFTKEDFEARMIHYTTQMYIDKKMHFCKDKDKKYTVNLHQLIGMEDSQKYPADDMKALALIAYGSFDLNEIKRPVDSYKCRQDYLVDAVCPTISNLSHSLYFIRDFRTPMNIASEERYLFNFTLKQALPRYLAAILISSDTSAHFQHFVYRTSPLDREDSRYLAGAIKSLNAITESGYTLTNQDKLLLRKSVNLVVDSMLKAKENGAIFREENEEYSIVDDHSDISYNRIFTPESAKEYLELADKIGMKLPESEKKQVEKFVTEYEHIKEEKDKAFQEKLAQEKQERQELLNESTKEEKQEETVEKTPAPKQEDRDFEA